ncbi:hypothetical protein CRI70_32525, partial [Streptomyces sp. Ru87]
GCGTAGGTGPQGGVFTLTCMCARHHGCSLPVPVHAAVNTRWMAASRGCRGRPPGRRPSIAYSRPQLNRRFRPSPADPVDPAPPPASNPCGSPGRWPARPPPAGAGAGPAAPGPAGAAKTTARGHRTAPGTLG